jgi:GrpB-like predicted nucleotidyltransferase (UPF0157 family)
MQKIGKLADEKLWTRVEAKAEHIYHLEICRRDSRSFKHMEMFLDALQEKLDPSQQDELRKLREDKDFSADNNSRSNEQKVRKTAGKEFWKKVDASTCRGGNRVIK